MYSDSFLLYEKTVWTRRGITVVIRGLVPWYLHRSEPLMQIAFVFLIRIRGRAPTSYFVFLHDTIPV